MNLNFETGRIVCTANINAIIESDTDFRAEISDYLSRYLQMDWGDTCEEDCEANNAAVENGDDRIVAVYNSSKGKIFIITEWDRSCTTVLFTYEY